ncbi:LANO_0H20142g1_1 [Lachancea nothofagi CBS 11611]|uniref:DNA primase n=1 Tax=Lachancea nothofagi CBS 11611 TaxID=1266666 RepID=A0A1G4KNA5_9SACH|nr:LANO_0H20142g1_1 [Lachancea nothofagi CBS 11611]
MTMQSAPPGNGPSATDMQYYYQYLYPFKPVFHWLNHSPKPGRDMMHRELAMAFRSGAYKRYNSFDSVQDFKAQIQRANPDRFEIGAIYNKPPRQMDSILKADMKPLEKEVVFDIDMDDYDSYRTCCSGANVCSKCWKFISLAMKVLNVSLEEDFGYTDYIWVFSGRRGAHCWVTDKRARQLNDIQRRNVLDYMNVVRERNMSKRLNLKRPYHPHLVRSLDILKPYFVEIILREQNPWQEDEAAIQGLLPGLHDKVLIEILKKHWKMHENRTSEQKWSDIDSLATSQLKHQSALKKSDYFNKLRECKEDLVLATLYPKLDVEVTKQTIHLLKAPFCIHPATGNVCVPITENFTPSDAPKLIQLQSEMETNGNRIESTSLQPFLDQFQQFVNQVTKRELASSKREREDELNDDF